MPPVPPKKPPPPRDYSRLRTGLRDASADSLALAFEGLWRAKQAAPGALRPPPQLGQLLFGLLDAQVKIQQQALVVQERILDTLFGPPRRTGGGAAPGTGGGGITTTILKPAVVASGTRGFSAKGIFTLGNPTDQPRKVVFPSRATFRQGGLTVDGPIEASDVSGAGVALPPRRSERVILTVDLAAGFDLGDWIADPIAISDEGGVQIARLGAKLIVNPPDPAVPHRYELVLRGQPGGRASGELMMRNHHGQDASPRFKSSTFAPVGGGAPVQLDPSFSTAPDPIPAGGFSLVRAAAALDAQLARGRFEGTIDVNLPGDVRLATIDTVLLVG